MANLNWIVFPVANRTDPKASRWFTEAVVATDRAREGDLCWAFHFLAERRALATRYQERHAATGLRFKVKRLISTRVG